MAVLLMYYNQAKTVAWDVIKEIARPVLASAPTTRRSCASTCSAAAGSAYTAPPLFKPAAECTYLEWSREFGRPSISVPHFLDHFDIQNDVALNFSFCVALIEAKTLLASGACASPRRRVIALVTASPVRVPRPGDMFRSPIAKVRDVREYLIEPFRKVGFGRLRIDPLRIFIEKIPMLYSKTIRAVRILLRPLCSDFPKV
jgi:hypothetical protein